MLDKKQPGKMIPDKPRKTRPEAREETGEKIPAAGRPGRRSPVSGLLPGLVLVLLGVLFLLDNAGKLPGEDWWQYFLVGLGLIFIILAWVQYVNPRRGRPQLWRILAGLGLIATGLVFLFGYREWWPVVLIIVGVLLMLVFVFRRDNRQGGEENPP
jgi:hypothetical protein